MALRYRLLPQLDGPRQHRISVAHPPLGPHETWTVADLPGPGAITHLWFGVTSWTRSLALRMYWDEENTPSVDVPLVDFFGGGYAIRSDYLAVAPNGGYSAYFPMPFFHRALVQLVNLSDTLLSGGDLLAQVGWDAYKEDEVRDPPPTFHAQWNREHPADHLGRRVCLCRATGRGAYLGTTVQIRPHPEAGAPWYEAPGDLHFVDGLGRARLLAGTAVQNYLGATSGQHAFSLPLAGLHLADNAAMLYRFHAEAPILFRDSLYSLLGSVRGDYIAVSYWYQDEPHRDAFLPLDAAAIAPDAYLPPGARDLPPQPQEIIEWLYGDGTRKAVGRYHMVDLHEYLHRGTGRWREGTETIRATFVSPETRTAQLYVSYDDRIRVSLNGRLVFERERPEGFGADPVAVMIPAGENTVAIETTNTMNTTCGAWVIGFRVANSEGRTIKEMEFRAYPDIPEGNP